MRTEQEIVDLLCRKFDFLRDNIYVQRPKRILTRFLPPEQFEPVIHYLHDSMDFTKAHHVIGTDEGEDLGFIYLLSNADYIMLALKEKTPKANPKINAMTPLYPSLLIHERELVDLFGAEISGLGSGPTYPLPDGWPKGNYPLRKEWNPAYFDQSTMTYNPPQDTAGKGDEEK